MAILTKEKILERVKKGDINFSPSLDRFQLQNHSVDLRLGFSFLVPKLSRVIKEGRVALNLDYFQKEHPQYFDIVELEQGQYFEILPQEYIMATSLESIKLPNDLMGILFPRSSVNRKGLSVDLSGIVDAGYQGQLFIPVRNNTLGQIVKLYPGERFCQILFEELTGQAEIKQSKYHKKDIISGVAKSGVPEEDEMIQKGEIEKLKRDFKVSVQL